MNAFRRTLTAAAWLLIAAPVSAQTGGGGFAGVTVSALTVERDTTGSIAASIGYQLNPIVALGVELTFVPSFRPHVREFPSILNEGFAISGWLGGAIFPGPEISVEAEGGRATIFTATVRLTIPTRSARLSPFVVAGAGVGNVRDDLLYRYEYRPFITPGFGGGTIVLPGLSESIRRTTTDFAMTFGGGVSVSVSDSWSIDGDVRYVGVAGDRDIHTGRYGGGITFRF
jgi:opacity protein-like surface antigen